MERIIHKTTGDRMPALDGLRGIAILLVLLLHFTYYGGIRPTTIIDNLFYKVAVYGWIGVDLFFVLSGFLITGILYDTKTSAHYFRNFYLRRFVRIFPLYYGTLFVFFVVLPQIAPSSREIQLLVNQQGWYWSYLTNFLIALKDWSPFGIIEHFWSLAIEEQFYLFWPVVVLLFDRRKLIGICLICILISLGVRVELVHTGHATAAHVLTPARMDSLAVGALLALISRGPGGLSRLKRWIWPVMGGALVALIAIGFWRQGLNSEDTPVQTVGYTLLAFLFGAFLLLAVTALPGTAIGKIFASPVLRFFGRYSYALYVFHQPVVFYMVKHLFTVQDLPRILGLQLPSQLFFLVIGTGISLLLALLSWHLYEQQFHKLKRLFPYRYEPSPLPNQAYTGTR